MSKLFLDKTIKRNKNLVKAALVMMKNNIPIAHCGHIGQISKVVMEKVIEYGVEYITSYSLDKIHEINNVAKKAK